MVYPLSSDNGVRQEQLPLLSDHVRKRSERLPGLVDVLPGAADAVRTSAGVLPVGSFASALSSAGRGLESRVLPFPRNGFASTSDTQYAQAMAFDYLGYLERKNDVCGGQLVIRGTRVTVRTLLASFAEGASIEELQADFPTVSGEAFRAVVAFAAVAAADDLPTPPIPVAA